MLEKRNKSIKGNCLNNKLKKMKLLENDNAKVVICNTPEAKMFAEMIPNIDKLYKYLRNNVGSEKVALEYFDENRRDILYLAEKLNSMIQKIADEKGLTNINKISI